MFCGRKPNKIKPNNRGDQNVIWIPVENPKD